ncbi:MAG: hypothetical protein JO090_09560 [Rhizobacter sp.]|nr:hypothetical protein [Rhizobacter sp.]
MPPPRSSYPHPRTLRAAARRPALVDEVDHGGRGLEHDQYLGLRSAELQAGARASDLHVGVVLVLVVVHDAGAPPPPTTKLKPDVVKMPYAGALSVASFSSGFAL